MDLYAQVVVPLLCDFGLGRPLAARYRRELLAHAGGGIVESLALGRVDYHGSRFRQPEMARRTERRVRSRRV
jgi:hypothetical protein